MKIKLKRPLWNHKAGDEIETGENFGTWAVNKGYAESVAEPAPENKAIVPEYKQRKQRQPRKTKRNAN